MGAVGEHDRRDDVVAVVPLLDGPRAVGVDLDVVPLERDALVAEEPLGTTAVGTPARAIARGSRRPSSTPFRPGTYEGSHLVPHASSGGAPRWGTLRACRTTSCSPRRSWPPTT